MAWPEVCTNVVATPTFLAENLDKRLTARSASLTLHAEGRMISRKMPGPHCANPEWTDSWEMPIPSSLMLLTNALTLRGFTSRRQTPYNGASATSEVQQETWLR